MARKTWASSGHFFKKTFSSSQFFWPFLSRNNYLLLRFRFWPFLLRKKWSSSQGCSGKTLSRKFLIWSAFFWQFFLQRQNASSQIFWPFLSKTCFIFFSGFVVVHFYQETSVFFSGSVFGHFYQERHSLLLRAVLAKRCQQKSSFSQRLSGKISKMFLSFSGHLPEQPWEEKNSW